MNNLFEGLLKELSLDLSISLHAEDGSACSLKIDDKLLVAMQIDKTEEFLLIGSFLTELPPGIFRENIFLQTLKANSQIPKIGNFAFNEKNSALVLFERFPIVSLKGEELKDVLAQFTEKAIAWKEAIESDNIAPLEFLREARQQKTSPLNIKP